MAAGHFFMAFPTDFFFYGALGLLIAGNGFFKPNISSLVGSLYKEGDIKRDSGFTIFYMGINLGAFLGALIVGIVAAKWGWHYGFGLAGIGMALGQVIYFYGLKYLTGVGDFLGAKDSLNKDVMKKPLNNKEKDRMLVMFLSFLIIIVFWGAFEILLESFGVSLGSFWSLLGCLWDPLESLWAPVGSIGVPLATLGSQICSPGASFGCI